MVGMLGLSLEGGGGLCLFPLLLSIGIAIMLHASLQLGFLLSACGFSILHSDTTLPMLLSCSRLLQCPCANAKNQQAKTKTKTKGPRTRVSGFGIWNLKFEVGVWVWSLEFGV
jgi:hypothetical protein